MKPLVLSFAAFICGAVYGQSHCLEIGFEEGCAQVLTNKQKGSFIRGKSDIEVFPYFVHLKKKVFCRCYFGII